MKTDPGLSIARLRRKFGVADSQVSGNADFADVDQAIETVQVESKKGGAPKTADYDRKTGSVKIVQG